MTKQVPLAGLDGDTRGESGPMVLMFFRTGETEYGIKQVTVRQDRLYLASIVYLQGGNEINQIR